MINLKQNFKFILIIKTLHLVPQCTGKIHMPLEYLLCNIYMYINIKVKTDCDVWNCENE